MALFRRVVPGLLGAAVLRRNRELPLLLAVAAGLGAAVGAHALGLSPAIGAFLAGMMLAESPFATQVRADIGALRTVRVMLFFGSIGMLGNVGLIIAHVGFVLPFVAAVVVTLPDSRAAQAVVELAEREDPTQPESEPKG